jgi:PAS domain S-box-containing protein
MNLKKNIRILYVEDVPADVGIMEHELRRAGFDPHSERVETRDDFLFQLEHYRPDVIISDHGLPRFDGFAALAIAKEKCPDVPFIFVTGSLGEEVAIKTFESGATNYVLKSNLGKLAPTMHRALREADERAELKRKEERLHQSEERFRKLVEGVTDYSIYLLDPEGRVATWNAGAEQITGYTAEEAVGKPLSFFFTDADNHEGLPAQVLEKANSDGRWTFEGWHLRKDGSHYWSQSTITALRNSSGELIGFSRIGRDITGQKQAEEGFRRLAAIVESSDDAIFSKSLDGVIATWNPGAERLYGYSAEEVIGQTILMLSPPDRRDEEQRIIAQINQGKTVPYFDTVRRRKDGRLVQVSITISPIKDAAGKVIGASQIARDITDRRQAEERLRALNQELEQRVHERTAQLEASNRELEAFSYSVSHDLRAPLRHILGYVDILESEAEKRLDENDKQTLRTIAESAQQMGQLIDALLAFSRMGRAELRLAPVSLAALVEEARHDLRNECKDRDIDWQISDLPEVRGDPLMLRQVFINLISNALKYTRPRARARIEIGSWTDAKEVVCFVRDNGVGFAMEYAGKLFGVFQRLHQPGEFEGTGVGLAHVRQIISRHGGRTWAEGAPDAGATFYFSLPLNPKGELI